MNLLEEWDYVPNPTSRLPYEVVFFRYGERGPKKMSFGNINEAEHFIEHLQGDSNVRTIFLAEVTFTLGLRRKR